MPGKRDIVRLLPNERVDLLDFDAVQRNGRSDHRSHLASLLYGTNTSPAALKQVLGGFDVTEDSGGPSALIEITNGVAIGGEELPDADIEYGVVFGREVQTLQTLDFTGNPTNTYTIWVRYSSTPGEIGTRVFWNSGTTSEDVDAIETRYVVDWDVQLATSSPGNEWQAIATVVWDGVSIDNADITGARVLFFEGTTEPSIVTWGNSGAGNVYPYSWGDGANDRNADRGLYGPRNFVTWMAAIERTIGEIKDIRLQKAWWDDVRLSTPQGIVQTRYNVVDVSDVVVGSWNDAQLISEGDDFAVSKFDTGILDYLLYASQAGADDHVRVQAKRFHINTQGHSPEIPNIHFGDPVTYQTVERSAFIPANGFQPAIQSGGVTDVVYEANGGQISNDDADATFLYLPLALFIPDGARLVSYRVFYNMTRTSNNLIVNLRQYTTVPANADATGWTFDYSSDDGSSTVDSSFLINNAGTPLVLDLGTGSAWMRVQLVPTDATEDCEFHGIRFTWDQNKLFPDGLDY